MKQIKEVTLGICNKRYFGIRWNAYLSYVADTIKESENEEFLIGKNYSYRIYVIQFLKLIYCK